MTKNLFVFSLICLSIVTGCRGETQESRASLVVNRIGKELSLSDPQKAKLEVIKQQWLKSRNEQKTERKKSQDQIITMIRGDHLDTGALQTVIKKRQESLEIFFSKNSAWIADFHSSLTPQQRNKLADRIEEFRNKFDRE